MRGKVRDLYDLGEALLFVATDRISTFDVVLPTGIPGKGEVLTQLSVFWFEWLNKLKTVLPHHLITQDVECYPKSCRPYHGFLKGRSMIVRKARPLPIECIVRGYLVGSGLLEYQQTGSVSGEKLPPGLTEAAKLPEAIFTPSTKAAVGSHDVSISMAQVKAMIGDDLAHQVKVASLTLYREASAWAAHRGILIADTKFEFGLDTDGHLMLIDEVLTPDSSRFWPADAYLPGKKQASFDKQYVRDYLLSVGWRNTDPPPYLPKEVVNQTRMKYIEAFQRLTASVASVDASEPVNLMGTGRPSV